MTTVEIIAVGNELLVGDVLDTNTNWLCKKFTGIGGKVQRAVMVGDDLQSIGRQLKSTLNRETKLIIVMGGLGPTADDMTLQAVAQAIGRKLELNSEALRFVAERYRDFAAKGYVDDPSMTPSRQKMAILPEGATPLDNFVGAAPAVLLHVGESIVVCLPGVPTEMKSIFEGSLQPTLTELFGESHFLEKAVIVNSKDESALAPILKQVGDENPRVYVKSRPKRFGPDVKIRVTLSMSGRTKEEVETTIDSAIKDLRSALDSEGISIDTIETVV